MFATGTTRVQAGYPKHELEAVHLTTRGHFTWLKHDDSMLALRWKDRKDIFLLSTIHSSPSEIPDCDSDSSSDASDEDHRYVQRRFKQSNGTWKTKKLACPQVVKGYNKYMGVLIFVINDHPQQVQETASLVLENFLETSDDQHS